MKAPKRNLDRISFLPEHVRRNIICFLSMEDAIKTSVLSKNWRYVCCSLPNLNFYDWRYTSKKRKNPGLGEFRDIVYQTLSLHDEWDIHTFSVSIVIGLAEVSSRDLNSWTCFAIQHNVQHICLQPFHTCIEKLPMCLFTCNTLKVLKLDNVHLHLPAAIAFPLLISLCLDRVKFVDKILTNKLLSSCSCPVLEVLKLECCFQDYADMHTISFTRLEHLKLITNLGDINVKIKISVPHLHKFEYQGNEPPNLTTATLSSIACASFMINEFPDNEYLDCFINYASSVLFGIGNVKDLTLCEDFVEFLTRDQDFLKSLTSVCHSLKVLRLNMSSAKNQVDATTLLLRKFPNLQILRLSIYEGDCNSSDTHNMKDYWQFSKASAQDVLKHLKTVEIKLFHKNENMLDLVRYILETACSLEKMSIKFVEYARECEEDKMRLCQKLLRFTRVSPNAAVFFS